jgi:hypothetical protein
MMINCRKATLLASESRERLLSRWEHLQLAFHTAMCRLCRQFGRDVEILGALAKASNEAEPENFSLSSAARQRITHALARAVTDDKS